MMTPESIAADSRRRAIELTRESVPSPHVDDETLATLIDQGIDAVEPHERAALLRAIGTCPEIAAVVAHLAPTAPRTIVHGRTGRPLGIPAVAWRMAWAACLICALGVTMWHILSPVGPDADVTLLDGGVDGPSQDFADSLQRTIRRATVFLLWLSLAALTIPAFLSGPRAAAQVRAAPRDSSPR